MAEPKEPTLTEMRLELQRWMEARGTYSVCEVLMLHLLAHAEVTRRLDAIVALRRLYGTP